MYTEFDLIKQDFKGFYLPSFILIFSTSFIFFSTQQLISFTELTKCNSNT